MSDVNDKIIWLSTQKMVKPRLHEQRDTSSLFSSIYLQWADIAFDRTPAPDFTVTLRGGHGLCTPRGRAWRLHLIRHYTKPRLFASAEKQTPPVQTVIVGEAFCVLQYAVSWVYEKHAS